MINIERTHYAYAEIQTSPEELKALQTLVEYALTHYDHTNLDFLLPAKAEECFNSLQRFSQRFSADDELPYSIHKDDLQILLVIANEADDWDMPGIETEQRDTLIQDLGRYSIRTLFDDELTDEARQVL